jgi:glutamate racemase
VAQWLNQQQKMESSGYIGIFDSGLGGLTVLREISRALPRESLIYLGDSARLPYGPKSASTIVRYAREAADHLLSRDVKMLVIACNTATAAALGTLQQELDIPVVGVIEPGARAAVKASRGRIGVIATEGTIRSGAYRKALHRLDPGLEVREAACPLFVPLAEEGWANTRVCQEIAGIYLEPLLDERIDTLLLGCTHYPILRGTIRKVAGPGVRVIDSAEATARWVARELRRLGIHSEKWPEVPCRFLVTDDAARFRRIAAEFLDHRIEHLELVELERTSPEAASEPLRASVPTAS